MPEGKKEFLLRIQAEFGDSLSKGAIQASIALDELANQLERVTYNIGKISEVNSQLSGFGESLDLLEFGPKNEDFKALKSFNKSLDVTEKEVDDVSQGFSEVLGWLEKINQKSLDHYQVAQKYETGLLETLQARLSLADGFKKSTEDNLKVSEKQVATAAKQDTAFGKTIDRIISGVAVSVAAIGLTFKGFKLASEAFGKSFKKSTDDINSGFADLGGTITDIILDLDNYSGKVKDVGKLSDDLSSIEWGQPIEQAASSTEDLSSGINTASSTLNTMKDQFVDLSDVVENLDARTAAYYASQAKSETTLAGTILSRAAIGAVTTVALNQGTRAIEAGIEAAKLQGINFRLLGSTLKLAQAATTGLNRELDQFQKTARKLPNSTKAINILPEDAEKSKKAIDNATQAIQNKNIVLHNFTSLLGLVGAGLISAFDPTGVSAVIAPIAAADSILKKTLATSSKGIGIATRAGKAGAKSLKEVSRAGREAVKNAQETTKALVSNFQQAAAGSDDIRKISNSARLATERMKELGGEAKVVAKQAVKTGEGFVDSFKRSYGPISRTSKLTGKLIKNMINARASSILAGGAIVLAFAGAIKQARKTFRALEGVRKSVRLIGFQWKTTKEEAEAFTDLSKTLGLLYDISADKVANITQKFIEQGRNQQEAGKATALALEFALREGEELETVVAAISSAYSGSATEARALGLASLAITQDELKRGKVLDNITERYKEHNEELSDFQIDSLEGMQESSDKLDSAMQRLFASFDVQIVLFKGLKVLWNEISIKINETLAVVVNTLAYIVENTIKFFTETEEGGKKTLSVVKKFFIFLDQQFINLFFRIEKAVLKARKLVRILTFRDTDDLDKKINRINVVLENAAKDLADRYATALEKQLTKKITIKGYIQAIIDKLSKEDQPKPPEDEDEKKGKKSKSKKTKEKKEKPDKTQEKIAKALEKYGDQLEDLVDTFRERDLEFETVEKLDGIAKALEIDREKNKELGESLKAATEFLKTKGVSAGVDPGKFAEKFKRVFGENNPLFKSVNEISTQLGREVITAESIEAGIKKLGLDTATELKNLRLEYRTIEDNLLDAREANEKEQIKILQKLAEDRVKAGGDDKVVKQLEKNAEISLKNLQRSDDAITKELKRIQDEFVENREKVVDGNKVGVDILQKTFKTETDRVVKKAAEVARNVKEQPKTLAGFLKSVYAKFEGLLEAQLSALNSITNLATNIQDPGKAKDPILQDYEDAQKEFADTADELAKTIDEATDPDQRKEALKEYDKLLKTRRKAETDFIDDLKKAEDEVEAQNAGLGRETSKDYLKDVTAIAADALVPGLGQAVGPLIDLLDSSPEKISQAIERFYVGMYDIISDIVANLPGIIFGIIEGINNAIPKVINNITSKIPILIDNLVNYIPRIIETLIDLLVNVFSIKGDVIFAIIKAIPQIIKAVILLIPRINRAFLFGIINAIKKIAKGIIKVGKSVFKIIIGVAKSFVKVIQEFLKRPWQGIGAAVKKATESFQDFTQKHIQDYIDGTGIYAKGQSAEEKKAAEEEKKRNAQFDKLIQSNDRINNRFQDTLKKLPAISQNSGKLDSTSAKAVEREKLERAFAHTAANAFNPFLEGRDKKKEPLNVTINIGAAKLADVLLNLQESGYKEVFAT